MDVGHNHPRDVVGDQWPGLPAGSALARQTGLGDAVRDGAFARWGRFADTRFRGGIMADGLFVGPGDHLARVRAVQCAESQGEPAVYLLGGVLSADGRGHRIHRRHRVAAADPRSGKNLAGVLEVPGHGVE
ncbi:MAG: hypothetical protein ACK55Z_31380, partial [bacterium]